MVMAPSWCLRDGNLSKEETIVSQLVNDHDQVISIVEQVCRGA